MEVAAMFDEQDRVARGVEVKNALLAIIASLDRP